MFRNEWEEEWPPYMLNTNISIPVLSGQFDAAALHTQGSMTDCLSVPHIHLAQHSSVSARIRISIGREFRGEAGDRRMYVESGRSSRMPHEIGGDKMETLHDCLGVM